MSQAKSLSEEELNALIEGLRSRFEANMQRHPGFVWIDIEARLRLKSDKVWSLLQMEITGGEPDVITRDDKSGAYIFYDCAKESPKGRRSLCYDQAAWISRKAHKPIGNVLDTADAMGVELLSEEQYRALQEVGEFDLKTSSWVSTPSAIRSLGGALFCDRRYNTVFLYHNGADSYYGARGFRACLHV